MRGFTKEERWVLLSKDSDVVEGLPAIVPSLIERGLVYLRPEDPWNIFVRVCPTPLGKIAIRLLKTGLV